MQGTVENRGGGGSGKHAGEKGELIRVTHRQALFYKYRWDAESCVCFTS